MIKKTLFNLILFLSLVFYLNAQSFISGRVIDKETKNPLPAYISIKDTDTGCSADYNGAFRLEIESVSNKETVKLVVYLIGYKKKEVVTKIGEELTIELELKPLPSHEVVVIADSMLSEEKSQKTVTLKKMDVYTLPGTAADPMYASKILPGVNSLPDSSSMLIRGGSPEEVAYYLDGIEIEHPFLSESLHEGYFSIFDNQIIEGFSISTSGFHAKYGDALSGIMAISAKDKLSKSEGGIGLSVLGLNSYIGGPIKESGSYVASYNRGHSALMTKINNREESEFQTENAFAKLTIDLNNSHSIRLLGIYDNYNFKHDNGFRTNSKNDIAGLSLTSTWAKNLVMRLTLSRVKHDSSFSVSDIFEKDFKDNVLQARLETSFDLESHYFEFGADIQKRKLSLSYQEIENFPEESQVQGTRLGIYFNDKLRVTDKFFVTLGGKLYFLNINKNKVNFDPRVSLALFLTRNDILRFSTGIHHQYGDYFTLKNNDLKAKNAAHSALSYDKISENLDLRITLYNKAYRNLFLSEAEGFISNEGQGYARGAEFYIKQKSSKFDALFVYNFLDSKRKENNVLNLATSPYEIKHSMTAIFTYKFNNTNLGIRFSYATGLPYTPLAGREWDDENMVYLPVWGDPYSQRYPSYQRLDINGSKTFSFIKRLIVVYFGITNVLNHKNILRYEYSSDYSVRSDNYSIFGRSVFFGIYIPFY